jgi:predicted aconitase
VSTEKTDPRCGTAAGYNALGTEHRRTCEPCKAASRKWMRGFQRAARTGTHLAWAEANPPRTVSA